MLPSTKTDPEKLSSCSSSKPSRSPFKSRNVIIEHYSRCDKVEVDPTSYENETKRALEQLDCQLQNEKAAVDPLSSEEVKIGEDFESSNDNENGLNTPEEVVSDCDVFYTPQSVVKSPRLKNKQHLPANVDGNSERTPLASTSCAKSAFDSIELQNSLREMDEVSDRLNRSLVSHLDTQTPVANRSLRLSERLHAGMERQDMIQLDSDWNSPQKHRPGFESHFVSERQSLPHNNATDAAKSHRVSLPNGPTTNLRSSKMEENGLGPILEDLNLHTQDVNISPGRSDISRAKVLGLKLQQNMDHVELVDQLETQLDEVAETGQEISQAAANNISDNLSSSVTACESEAADKLEHMLNSITLHDCSLLDNIPLKDSGRRFRTSAISSTSINALSNDEGSKYSNARSSNNLPCRFDNAERITRQKSIRSYLSNLGGWYEAERMRINTRRIVLEEASQKSTELLRLAKYGYEKMYTSAQKLANIPMEKGAFKRLINDLKENLESQVASAVHEASMNMDMIRKREDAKKESADVSTRSVATAITPHSARAPVVFEVSDLDKSVEIRRWSLHEKTIDEPSKNGPLSSSNVEKPYTNDPQCLPSSVQEVMSVRDENDISSAEPTTSNKAVHDVIDEARATLDSPVMNTKEIKMREEEDSDIDHPNRSCASPSSVQIVVDHVQQLDSTIPEEILSEGSIKIIEHPIECATSGDSDAEHVNDVDQDPGYFNLASDIDLENVSARLSEGTQLPREPRYRLDLSALETTDISETKDNQYDSLDCTKTPRGSDARLSTSFGSPRSPKSPQEKYASKFATSPRQLSPLTAVCPSNTSLMDDEDDFLSHTIKPTENAMLQGGLSAVSREAYFAFASKNFSDPQWVKDQVHESCKIIWSEKEELGFITSCDLISNFKNIVSKLKPVSSKCGEIRSEWKDDINSHRAQIYAQVTYIASTLWRKEINREDMFSGLPRTSKFSRQDPGTLTFEDFVVIAAKNVQDGFDGSKNSPPEWSSAFDEWTFEKQLASKMAESRLEQIKEDTGEISKQLPEGITNEMAPELIESVANEYLTKKRDGWEVSDEQVFAEELPDTSMASIKKPLIFDDSLDESLL